MYKPAYVFADKENKLDCHFQCVNCDNMPIVTVSQEQYDSWKDGEFVQKAFPHLSADERELFISGICDGCWKEMNNA
jgi:hypothetical protein